MVRALGAIRARTDPARPDRAGRVPLPRPGHRPVREVRERLDGFEPPTPPIATADGREPYRRVVRLPQLREFLSRGIEIESKGMRAEAIESEADIDLMLQNNPLAQPGLIQDAHAMLRWWGLMTADERRTYHRRFDQLRIIIINRIVVEGTEGQQRQLGPFVVRLYDADAGVP